MSALKMYRVEMCLSTENYLVKPTLVADGRVSQVRVYDGFQHT